MSRKQNIDADALSRIPWETEQVSITLEQGLCGVSHMPTVPINMMSLKPEILSKLTTKDLIEEQNSDSDIRQVIELIKSNKHLQYKCAGPDSDEVKAMLKFCKDLTLQNRLLNRKTQLKGHNMPIKQFIAPKSFRMRTIQSMHSELGHLGMDHTLSLLQDRLFWYHMHGDV